MEDSVLIQERLRKLEEIKNLGVNPYPAKFDRTHTLTEAHELAEKKGSEIEKAGKNKKSDVKVAGRIMTLREHGKLIFAQLQDQTGRFQVCWMRGYTPDEQFDFVRLLDLGDFIGLNGVVFKTHKGEPTLLIAGCQLLAKSLRPLPDKWHGLKDREACYRERHLDLVMNPETKKRFEFRSRLVQKLRDFYYKNGFIELETPVLENISSGATAKPFSTHHNALDIDVYLRIAAGELWQKTAVVGGFEKTFEVARCFRNEGMDPSHLQEFTMVEHYAAYWNFEDNMRFTEQMFEWLLKELLGTTKVVIKDPEGRECEVDFKAPWPRKKFYDLVKKDAGIDPAKFSDTESLRAEIKKKGIVIEDINKMGFGALADHLYKKVSRPKLIGPLFVIEHPVEMKPLARKSDANHKMCDTFQLLVNGWEIVNAYGEIVDPLDQRERFTEQAKVKAKGDEEAMMFNEEYLRVMEHGMPPMSGWGMGIDRLVTLLTQQDNLKDAVLFPLMRPLNLSDKPEKIMSGEPPAAVAASGDDGKNINVGISYADAKKLFEENIKDPANRAHMRESEVVMRGLARKLGANEEAWGVLGLLHDIDWEKVQNDLGQHCSLCEEILRGAGVSQEAIQVIQSHGYGVSELAFTDKQRTRLVEHALAAGETITGLIYATALMQPEKKIATVEVKSIKKKFKDKAFAAKVNRDIIRECEKCGVALEEFFEIALNAMKAIAGEIGV